MIVVFLVSSRTYKTVPTSRTLTTTMQKHLPLPDTHKPNLTILLAVIIIDNYYPCMSRIYNCKREFLHQFIMWYSLLIEPRGEVPFTTNCCCCACAHMCEDSLATQKPNQIKQKWASECVGCSTVRCQITQPCLFFEHVRSPMYEYDSDKEHWSCLRHLCAYRIHVSKLGSPWSRCGFTVKSALVRWRHIHCRVEIAWFLANITWTLSIAVLHRHSLRHHIVHIVLCTGETGLEGATVRILMLTPSCAYHDSMTSMLRSYISWQHGRGLCLLLYMCAFIVNCVVFLSCQLEIMINLIVLPHGHLQIQFVETITTCEIFLSYHQEFYALNDPVDLPLYILLRSWYIHHVCILAVWCASHGLSWSSCPRVIIMTVCYAWYFPPSLWWLVCATLLTNNRIFSQLTCTKYQNWHQKIISSHNVLACNKQLLYLTIPYPHSIYAIHKPSTHTWLNIAHRAFNEIW